MSTEQAVTAERARAPGRGPGRGIPYSIAYVRSDRWGQLAREAERWALATGQGAKSRATDVGERIAELQIAEQYFAYPGAAQMEALRDLCAAGDARAVARL